MPKVKLKVDPGLLRQCVEDAEDNQRFDTLQQLFIEVAKRYNAEIEASAYHEPRAKLPKITASVANLRVKEFMIPMRTKPAPKGNHSKKNGQLTVEKVFNLLTTSRFNNWYLSGNFDHWASAEEDAPAKEDVLQELKEMLDN